MAQKSNAKVERARQKQATRFGREPGSLQRNLPGPSRKGAAKRKAAKKRPNKAAKRIQGKKRAFREKTSPLPTLGKMAQAKRAPSGSDGSSKLVSCLQAM